MTAPLKLYTYFRSSAAWRVRIALAVKGVAAEAVPISLIKDGGQQHGDAYTAINPQHLVPALVLPDGTALTQSLAIIDWLEAEFPTPSLLPADPLQRALVLAAAHCIAMDVHPINNLRVLNQLADQFGADADAKAEWMRHWMRLGFDALSVLLKSGPYCFGNAITLADLCLVPQIYNARRWSLGMSAWPELLAIEARCLEHPAFAATAPDIQPDAV